MYTEQRPPFRGKKRARGGAEWLNRAARATPSHWGTQEQHALVSRRLQCVEWCAMISLFVSVSVVTPPRPASVGLGAR